MTALAQPRTSSGWRIWTRPINANNCFSKCSWTSGTPSRRKLPSQPDLVRTPSPPYKPSARSSSAKGNRMTVRMSVAALAAVGLAACSPKADYLITNGMVWTGLSTGNPQPGQVAIGGGKILAVGDSVSLARYVGGATKVIDARGGLVTPGFSDAPPEQTDSALARALRYAASLGVTATSHVSAGWDDLASWHRLERAGRLTMRVTLYMPLSNWRAVAESVVAHGTGDEWVRIGGLKGVMDGSAGPRPASFFLPEPGL